MSESPKELDKILDHFGERCCMVENMLTGTTREDEIAKSSKAILDWHNSEMVKTLDRIYEDLKNYREKHGELKLTYASYILSALQSERNKLERGENKTL